MKLIRSHGAVYSGEPDPHGFYNGHNQYALGPQGATFDLYWRTQAEAVPEVLEEKPGTYVIRNAGRERLEVWLHFRESDAFIIAPHGILRLTAGSIAAYMVSPRI